MAEARTDPSACEEYHLPSIQVHPLKSNKRPVGFAPWPKQKKRKRKKRG